MNNAVVVVGILMRQNIGSGGTSSGPTNISLPTITGLPIIGQTLTATNGVWGGSPTSFTYQWERNGVAIPGATNSTYVVTASDVGNNLTVVVTATSVSGSTPAESLPTFIVDYTPVIPLSYVYNTSIFTGNIQGSQFIRQLATTANSKTYKQTNFI